eukprot:762685-Hanusia_phi.AAC.1
MTPPRRGLLTEVDELDQQRRRVVLEGDALHLVVEHLRVVVAHGPVGGGVGVAEVEHEELPVMSQRQEARDHVDVVAVRRVTAEGRSRHGDDPVGDVGEVEVVAVLLVPPLVLRDGCPELL